MLLSLRNAWGAALLILVAMEVAAAYNRGSVLGYQRYRRRHISNVPCHNVIANDDDNFSDFESKIRETEVVFTGKVTELIATSVVRNPLKKDRGLQEEPSKFWVRVKRVLKGELPASVDEKQMTVKIRAMEKPKNQQQCYRRPIRVHHTAIFLARKTEDESGNIMLQLRAEPLPLTLRNLDKVNAAVKDMTYKPRSPIIEELCEKTYCAYGANCVQTADGRAECQCPSDCPSTFTPVCGTDGVTYSNHCVMRLKSCRQEKNTRVQHAGECDPRSPKRRHRG